jgi:hypothetical protein
MENYKIPDSLSGKIDQAKYLKWLNHTAQTHVRRDKKRGNRAATVSEYKKAIHCTVCSHGERDAYTDEPLDWELISTYENGKSKEEGRKYKAKFALQPTVDHVGDGIGKPEFKICAWRTNDAKNDLSLKEFVALCKKVVAANPM